MSREGRASTYAWFWRCFDAPRGDPNCFRSLAYVQLADSKELDPSFLGLEGLRLIDLRHLSNEEELYVENLGYCLRHLKRNVDMYGVEEDAFPYALPDAMTDEERRYVVQQASRTAFQVDALRDGYVTGHCPRTGEKVVSRCSILLDETEQPPYGLPAIFYRFKTDREVFYVACHGTVGWRTLVLIPEANLVIIGEPAYSDVSIEVALVEAFRRFILRNKATVIPYIEAQEAAVDTRKALVVKSTLNYSHQLLNDLSAIQRLIDSGEIRNVDMVLAGGVQFYGRLGEIFPEIAKEKVIELGSLAEISSYILKKRLFAIKAGYNFVQEAVIRRVISSVCAKGGELMTRAGELRSRYRPILWITIRSKRMNRTLENQAEVLSHVIRRLVRFFPSLGVIFDGFCLPESVDSEYAKIWREVIQEELATSMEIERRIGTDLVAYNLIGRRMSESIVLSQIVDVYLAHYGTLQHKVAWFSNKPGVEHGNSAVLKIPHVLALSRENAVAPTKLPLQCVEDVPESGGDRGERGNNYRVDPEVLAEHVRKLIQSQRD